MKLYGRRKKHVDKYLNCRINKTGWKSLKTANGINDFKFVFKVLVCFTIMIADVVGSLLIIEIYEHFKI